MIMEVLKEGKGKKLIEGQQGGIWFYREGSLEQGSFHTE
jgi:hypothetical protein